MIIKILSIIVIIILLILRYHLCSNNNDTNTFVSTQQFLNKLITPMIISLPLNELSNKKECSEELKLKIMLHLNKILDKNIFVKITFIDEKIYCYNYMSGIYIKDLNISVLSRINDPIQYIHFEFFINNNEIIILNATKYNKFETNLPKTECEKNNINEQEDDVIAEDFAIEPIEEESINFNDVSLTNIY